MKKFQKTLPVLMVVFGVSIVGLGGCQIFANNQPDANVGAIDHVPQDTRTGLLQSLGGAQTTNQGTNLLVMSDGTTVLLKSLTVNLDDPNYLGKNVDVTGELNYTTDNKPIMQVESIDVLQGDTNVATQQQAPQWVPYVNNGLGFQAKYRNDFQMNEASNSVTFIKAVTPSPADSVTQEQSSLTHTIMVEVTPKSSSQTLLQYLHLSDNNDSTLFAAGYSKSKVGMDGINAYKSITSNGLMFSFEDPNNFYQVSYVGGNDDQSLQDQNVFYDFLASFQLLNASSTQQVTDNGNSSTVPTTGSLITPYTGPNPGTNKPKKSAAGSNSAPSVATPTSTTSTTANSATTSTAWPSSIAPAPVAAPSPAPAIPTPTATATTGTSNSGTTLSDISASSNSAGGSTQELLQGYSAFISTGYKFSLEYPKNWYYGQTTATDTSVIRRYDFGSQPVDQTPGTVNLDIVKGSIPSGASYTLGDKTATMVSTDGVESYYYQGASGKIYRVSGPASDDFALRSMLSTLQEQ